MSDIHSLVLDIGKKAREASRSLAIASSLQKKDAIIFAHQLVAPTPWMGA